MATRFFANELTTGMTGSNIDADLAVTLAIAERRERRERGGQSTRGTSFSTLVHESRREEASAGKARRQGLCRRVGDVVRRLASK